MVSRVYRRACIEIGESHGIRTRKETSLEDTEEKTERKQRVPLYRTLVVPLQLLVDNFTSHESEADHYCAPDDDD